MEMGPPESSERLKGSSKIAIIMGDFKEVSGYQCLSVRILANGQVDREFSRSENTLWKQVNDFVVRGNGDIESKFSLAQQEKMNRLFILQHSASVETKKKK